MRILQVNSNLYGGGVDTQTLELCGGLIEQGHEVLLAVGRRDRWVLRAQQIPGLRIEHIEGGKLHWGLRLKALAERFQAQVLHAHHGRDYWTTGLGARLARHSPPAVLSRHLLTPLSSTSARWLLRLGHVHAVSKAVETQLRGELKGDLRRLHLIYSGIDLRRFKPDPALRAAARAALGWDESQVVFAMIGGGGPPDGKGQRVLLEAGKRLIAERPEVKLLFIGDGGLNKQIREEVAGSALEKSVVCPGFTEDVERVCALTDVLVHPAVGTEALGLVIWEGMAAARPVIASRLGGIAEAFVDPDHGRLVTPRSVDELYAAMAAFAADRALRERCGAAARQHLIDQGWTREGQARRFADFYQSLQPHG